MTFNSRELVKGLFESRNSDRPPFMPWVCSFAAKLEQVPVRSLLSDAGVLSKALVNTHKLFGYDVIVNHFDTTLEAEACGCEITWPGEKSMPAVTGHPLAEGGYFSDLDTAEIEKKGRIPVAIEAAKRVKIIKGKEVPIAATVTGPLTIARHLRGDSLTEALNQGDDESLELVEEAGSLCLKLCRTYCELGVDMIVIAEDLPKHSGTEAVRSLASPLRTIRNVTGFYKVKSVLVVRGCEEKLLAPVFELEADAVALSGNISNSGIREKAFERNRPFARSLPDSVFTAEGTMPGEAAGEYLREKVRGLFLSTEWELPCETDVNRMHELMKLIRSARDS